MKERTRRKLYWIGAVLILLPIVFLVVAYFIQAPEYQSSVFIEVRRSGAPSPISDAIAAHRDTIFAVLFVVSLFLPGVVVVAIGFLTGRSQRQGSSLPHI